MIAVAAQHIKPGDSAARRVFDFSFRAKVSDSLK
jgi:hypothetical protein